jgi:hypothetical protein
MPGHQRHGGSLDERPASWHGDAVNVERIRKRLHEDPSPFVVRLSDGRKFAILHQDYIAVGKNLVVVIHDDDSTVKIDPLHIVSLDDLRAKNGRPKRL